MLTQNKSQIKSSENLQDYNEGFLHDPLFRVNERAKRILFRFDHKIGRAVVVFPKLYHAKKAASYREAFNAWIQTIEKTTRKSLTDGQTLLYKGQTYRICFIHEPLYVHSRVDEVSGVLGTENLLVVRGRKRESIAEAVSNFLLHQAHTYATEMSHFYASLLNVTLEKITIRDLKSMWGRCMRQADLCYNWRLILAAPHIFDYVCAHEVSHCIHPDHSYLFWETVQSICPHFKESRSWLKKNSRELFCYELNTSI